MVTLLETRMKSPAPLLDGFGFTEMIEISTEGHAGGYGGSLRSQHCHSP